MNMQLLLLVFGLFYTSCTWAKDSSDEYFKGDGTQYTLSHPTNGNCNLMSFPTDAETMYAAVSPSEFKNTMNCGRCARVSCVDPDRCKGATSTSEIVYIIDQCPGCEHGDLDMSPQAFLAITGHQNDRVAVQWQYVDCPIDSSVHYCLKNGSNSFWTAIQPTNVVSGVVSMKVNGKATKMVDSAFYFVLDGNSQVETNLKALDIELQNQNGEVLKETINLSKGGCVQGEAQFTKGTPSTEKDFEEESDSDDKHSKAPSASPHEPDESTYDSTPAPTPKEPKESNAPVATTEEPEESNAPVTTAREQDASNNTDQSYGNVPVVTPSNDEIAGTRYIGGPSAYIQQANTKTEKESSVVSPSIIILFVLIVIGCIAFAVLAEMVKRKKRKDKQLDVLEAHISNVPSIVLYDEVLTPSTNRHWSFTSNV